MLRILGLSGRVELGENRRGSGVEAHHRSLSYGGLFVAMKIGWLKKLLPCPSGLGLFRLAFRRLAALILGSSLLPDNATERLQCLSPSF